MPGLVDHAAAAVDTLARQIRADVFWLAQTTRRGALAFWRVREIMIGLSQHQSSPAQPPPER
jgi:hypothetical protein